MGLTYETLCSLKLGISKPVPPMPALKKLNPLRWSSSIEIAVLVIHFIEQPVENNIRLYLGSIPRLSPCW